MSGASRIALYGFLIAALAYATPLSQAIYAKLFPDKAIALVVDPLNSPCAADYLLPPGNEDVKDSLWNSDRRQLNRWVSDGKIIHSESMQVGVSIRGNVDKAVAIRDISITVVERARPAAGTHMPGGGCGGLDEPEYLVVDLDSLPVKTSVPVSYLQGSTQQSSARKAAEKLGKSVSLPKQVTADGIYFFFLTGRTQSHDTRWIATVTWWDGEKEHTDRINHHGKPFRVSAPQP